MRDQAIWSIGILSQAYSLLDWCLHDNATKKDK